MFRGCTDLTSITIPNSVTSIGNEAFWGCSGLTSVVIGNSVTSIGNSAFRDCTGLTSVVIGNSVTSIGGGAFDNCKGLTAVHISDLAAWCNIDFASTGANPLYYAKNLYLNDELVTALVIPDNVTNIRDYAFYNCTGITSSTIPNSVTSIGNYAFSGCSGLTSVVIGNSVTSIGIYAFLGCSGLTSITIPNSVTSIGHHAFSGCTGLTSITIPNSVTSIEIGAFWACTGLTSVTIPNSVTSIGERAFGSCTGLKSVVIGNSVTSIGERAFYGCYRLKTVINFSNLAFSEGSEDCGCVACYADKVIYAPNGSIESDYVWYKNNNKNILACYLGNAKEIILPADYKGENYTIGADAFKGNTTITSVVIPNSVTSIGNMAFAACSGLTSITIPNSVTSIGNYAFYNCIGLTSITIPNSVTSIESYAFEGTAWYNNQPDGVVYAGKVLYKYKGTMPSNTSITIKDETLGIAGGAFYNCSGLTSITIPNSVTSIGDGAFSGCTGLKTVINFSNLTFSEGSEDYGYVACYADKVYNVPNGSKEGDFIFGKPNDVNTLLYYLGNATELTLPGDYKGGNYTIGANVFKGNTTITSVTIPNSVTSIDDDAFAGCTNVEKLYLDCAEVGDWFCGVSAMKEVTIGNGVTSIVASAFNGCTGLEKVNIGNIAAWCGIDFGSADANPLYYAKNLYLNGELLTSLTIPAEVAEVKDYAFYNCNGVTIIDIVDGVESIGNSAFYGCSDLETLYISNTIESIDDYAFAECNNLLEIKTGSKKAITASENVFSSDAYINACLYVPNGRKFAYERATPWYKFYIVEMDFTGIEDVYDEVKGENGKVKTIYDLNGRKVVTPKKGLYIIDGKKVLVK